MQQQQGQQRAESTALTAADVVHSIPGAAHVLILHKGKAGRLARDPHASQRAVAFKLRNSGDSTEAQVGPICRSIAAEL